MFALELFFFTKIMLFQFFLFTMTVLLIKKSNRFCFIIKMSYLVNPRTRLWDESGLITIRQITTLDYNVNSCNETIEYTLLI
jgi:hypothetical protein